MPTIRELVQAIARRSGVDAVVVVGRDGLPIDSAAANGIDSDSVAAVLPAVVRGMIDLGGAGGRGEFATAVVEFGAGMAVLAMLHADALLVILVRPETNVGSLLFDIRRHRTAIAGLL